MNNIKYIDLNSDVGESFGTYAIGRDEEIMKFITSANIACGMHAGDPLVMEKTVSLAKIYGVAIGAHPGYPDLQGFGRRLLHMNSREIKAYIIYQIGALQAFAAREGIKLQHVKVHGALYNLTMKDEIAAQAVVESVKEVDRDLIILTPFNSQMGKIARESGLKVCREFFADRAYDKDGFLIDRRREGALILDKEVVAERVLYLMKEEKVKTIEGEELPFEVDTICLHGDTPEAVNLAQHLCQTLKENWISLKPFGEWL